MRRAIWITVFVSVVGSSAAFAESEQTFCNALRQRAHANDLNNGLIFYRGAGRSVEKLPLTAEISRNVQTFYIYVRPSAAQRGRASLFNIKYVFKSSQPSARSEFVQLRNDLWNSRKYAAHRANIVRSCSATTVPGYERFHLQGGRDYCLAAYFHQQSPDFATLDPDERRRSFAFGDMLGPPQPHFFGQWIASLGPRSARAGEVVVNRYSYARSWIRNVRYGREADRCIAIKTDFPEGVESFQLRVTNHGTQTSEYFASRTWSVSFLP